ncbi:hypothetical protein ILT44_04395 [Microvirga sp. BT689]|uniref:hypothetical protein n=1 Tax=Microvirga arvi TaxID=2778731 RepID=UPI001950E418|nr:hypothetical protein [Microvirga arvi]MBM6579414.1 hypothetical protein [Microvirga arvi]
MPVLAFATSQHEMSSRQMPSSMKPVNHALELKGGTIQFQTKFMNNLSGIGDWLISCFFSKLP